MGSITAILKAVPSPALHRASGRCAAVLGGVRPFSAGLSPPSRAVVYELHGPPDRVTRSSRTLSSHSTVSHPFAISKTRSLASLVGVQVDFTGYTRLYLWFWQHWFFRLNCGNQIRGIGVIVCAGCVYVHVIYMKNKVWFL